MQTDVHGFYHSDTGSVQYIVAFGDTDQCAIIDPVLDFDRRSGKFTATSADHILDFANSRSLSPKWIIDTHPHADHVSASHYLAEKTGAYTAISERVKQVQQIWAERYDLPELCSGNQPWSRLVADGDAIEIDGHSLAFSPAPGHTLASTVIMTEDVAFVNDTIFMPDVGTARADFPGGNANALWHSICKILSLPQDMRLFVGHDYPVGRQPAWQTSVVEQRQNIHIKGHDEASFVQWRTNRDRSLPLPDLMLLALQLNLNGGKLPDPGKSGLRHLRLPIETSW